MWGTFKRQLLVAYLAVGFICLFLALFIGITVGIHTHGTEHYMAPAGVSCFFAIILVVIVLMLFQQFWCWIGNGSRYNAERYAGEYAWMWVALGVSAMTYASLSLVALGILRVSEDHWWKFEFNGRGDLQEQGQKRRSISMIAYVLTLTRSAGRLTFYLHQVPCCILHPCHTHQRCPLDQRLRQF